ncbi:MAG: class I SAM-dependent methyltransferase [Planctomycetota bacterium]
MTAWYEEAFRSDYLRVYPHRDDASAAAEVAEWIDRVPGLGDYRRVLDLACGAGRHLRALLAEGCEAIGIDLSRDLLREAREHGPAPVACADMRALPFANETFEAVVSFFSSFGYFADQADDAAVLAEVRRVLRPGGGFLLDLMDPETVRNGLVPHSEKEVDGIRIEETRSLTADGKRVEKYVVFEAPSGTRQWTESVRLYDPTEVEAMAEEAGLSSRVRFGGHGFDPWISGGTSRCVLLFVRELE